MLGRDLPWTLPSAVTGLEPLSAVVFHSGQVLSRDFQGDRWERCQTLSLTFTLLGGSASWAEQGFSCRASSQLLARAGGAMLREGVR